jgi:AP-4 complex subunit epsilon-1
MWIYKYLFILQVDRDLSFLNGYVQQALEKGAAPYISESKHSGVISVGSYRSQEQHETSAHTLRFEAYEMPKPSLPVATAQASMAMPTTDLVPVPEPGYYREDRQTTRSQTSGDSLSGEFVAKLRLDGVQKKWGRSTYSSSSTPSSSTSSQQATNGLSHSDGGGSTSSQTWESSYSSKRQQGTEVSAEKQRLAASLFGSSAAKADRKAQASRKTAKESPLAKKATVTNTAPQPVKEQVIPAAPPPDLLDLGEPVSSSPPSADPFSQLEGLLGPTSASPVVSETPATGSSKTPDLMSIFSDDVQTGPSSGSTEPTFSDASLTNSPKGATAVAAKKGHSIQDALQKDATARQVGVTPTGNNPNLFKDLLG